MQGPLGSYIFDADQTHGYGQGGPFLPTFVTHGHMYSASLGKFMSSSEYMLAQGEPLSYALPPDVLERFPSFVESSISKITPSEKIKLSGNSYDLEQVGAWLLYNLMNIELITAGNVSSPSSADQSAESSFHGQGSSESASPAYTPSGVTGVAVDEDMSQVVGAVAFAVVLPEEETQTLN
jgi:hypothetical protein